MFLSGKEDQKQVLGRELQSGQSGREWPAGRQEEGDRRATHPGAFGLHSALAPPTPVLPSSLSFDFGALDPVMLELLGFGQHFPLETQKDKVGLHSLQVSSLLKSTVVSWKTRNK